MKKVPVTIVTGALGSGKTTFVNYILTAEHGLKIGVIVNEFGEVGIDGELIVSSKEKLIELPNGCVCCTVRDDLIGAAKELLDSGKVEYLVVETSGMAEVVPVAVSFDVKGLDERTELDSIICVVDAENHADNLKRNATALEQVRCADIILLNKVDLVPRKSVEELKKGLKKLVAGVVIIETVKGVADLKLLLGVHKFSPKETWKREEHGHAHDPRIKSASCEAGPVDSDKVQKFLEALPRSIFRAKGIICIKESAQGAEDELRVIFHKVGKRVELEFSRPWNEGEERRTKIVFIGTDVDAKLLQTQLDKCA